MVAWLYDLAHVMSQCVVVGYMGEGIYTLCWPEDKEKEEKTYGYNILCQSPLKWTSLSSLESIS